MTPSDKTEYYWLLSDEDPQELLALEPSMLDSITSFLPSNQDLIPLEAMSCGTCPHKQLCLESLWGEGHRSMNKKHIPDTISEVHEACLLCLKPYLFIVRNDPHSPQPSTRLSGIPSDCPRLDFPLCEKPPEAVASLPFMVCQQCGSTMTELPKAIPPLDQIPNDVTLSPELIKLFELWGSDLMRRFPDMALALENDSNQQPLVTGFLIRADMMQKYFPATPLEQKVLWVLWDLIVHFRTVWVAQPLATRRFALRCWAGLFEKYLKA